MPNWFWYFPVLICRLHWLLPFQDAKWAQDDAEDALAIKGLMSDDPPTAHSSRRRSSSSRPTPSHDKRRNPATSPSPLSRKRPTEGSSGDEDSRTKQVSTFIACTPLRFGFVRTLFLSMRPLPTLFASLLRFLWEDLSHSLALLASPCAVLRDDCLSIPIRCPLQPLTITDILY